MFFIGVFGVEKKEKEIGNLNDISCRNCDMDLGGRVIKTFSFFHFFFIPIFKWNEKYYVVCNGCDFIYQVPIEKGKGFEKDKDVKFNYWDLKPVEERNEICSHGNICSNCGKVVENNFKYCPYCGEKIE
ncbi:zinc-ribbon domain-containing protein [Clostridium senegalense]|uniref:zinc-ribbon domain-containing protein n=1 Tax=Clostridium senegalense TaxID=1465809 RepID=UPI001C129178|nr:zinc-ribbon domain-containing protein [Clostridium senegalense]MBU5226366.1 zinc ribbon domain-containing protein [Clostridium senegalense]